MSDCNTEKIYVAILTTYFVKYEQYLQSSKKVNKLLQTGSISYFTSQVQYCIKILYFMMCI